MGENKFILPFAILFACFILWGIFYTSRINNKNIEIKEEIIDIEKETNNTSNMDNNENPEEDILIENYDLSLDGRDEIIEMMKKQTGSNQSYEIETSSKESENLEKKVDLCLSEEDERYKNIINTRLNIRDINYVGDENFLKFWKMYEEEHEKKRMECYQLYFN